MFIVFDGIDGCGKSTQVWKLARYLFGLSKYNHMIITREAYKDREIRKILSESDDPYLAKEKLTQLYIQDRREHVNELIKPALEKNFIVISDRYKYSNICFQGAQGEPVDKLVELNKSMPVPDFVFIIDTPVEIAFERMEEKLIKKEQKLEDNKFEKNKEFLEKVRKNYLKIPNIFPKEKIIVIDGGKSIEEIFSEIKKYFN